MHGNVAEWCYDYAATREVSYISQQPATNPVQLQHSDSHQIRGGSWASDSRDIRSDQRIDTEESEGGYYDYTELRVVRGAPIAAP